MINSACDQTSQKHIKMPLILASPFQGPLQINQGPLLAGSRLPRQIIWQGRTTGEEEAEEEVHTQSTPCPLYL